MKRRRNSDGKQQQTKKTKMKNTYNIEEIEILNKIGEGSDGLVYKAKHKKTGEILAVKKREEEEDLDTMAEIEVHKSMNHPSIVNLKYSIVEPVEHDTDTDSNVKFRGTMVMEYADNDLFRLLVKEKKSFTPSEVKCLMKQLLQGVEYIHANRVIHRDLKTSNLLLNNRGELKICDFGLAAKIDDDESSVEHKYEVVTLRYRAPELLLGANSYSTEIDMWSVGCIMGEMISGLELFKGYDTESDQLEKIYKVLGSPNEETWSGFHELVPERKNLSSNFVKNKRSKLRQMFPAMSYTVSGSTPVLSNAGFDLLSRLLTYDPKKRITAKEALNHQWFSEAPLPKSKDLMPTFPSKICEP